MAFAWAVSPTPIKTWLSGGAASAGVSWFGARTRTRAPAGAAPASPRSIPAPRTPAAAAAAPPSTVRRGTRRCNTSSIVGCSSFSESFAIEALLYLIVPPGRTARAESYSWKGLILAWIEGIAQAVADEREAEHCQGDRDGREDRQVPIEL